MVVRVSSRVKEDFADELEEARELVVPTRWIHALVLELRPHEATVRAEKLTADAVLELGCLLVPADGDHFGSFGELPRIVVVENVVSSATADVELEKVGAVLEVLDVGAARHGELGIGSLGNYSRIFLKALPHSTQKLLNGPIWTTGLASGWEAFPVAQRLFLRRFPFPFLFSSSFRPSLSRPFGELGQP